MSLFAQCTYRGDPRRSAREPGFALAAGEGDEVPHGERGVGEVQAPALLKISADVVGARVARTWGVYQPGRWYGQGVKEIRDPDFDRRTWWVGWLLLAMLPFGAWWFVRGSAIAAWIVLAPVVMVTATTVIGYGNPRFRAAAEPSLLVCFAAVVCWVQDRLREARA